MVRADRARGFTLVELMIVVAIIGILASVAIPAFIRYIRRGKTTEATMNIRKLYDSAVSYYDAQHAAVDGSILARQFVDPHAWSPAQGACCPQRCVPNPANFSAPTWQALNFSVDDPHFYSYQVAVGAGTGGAVGDYQQLQASGDLTCDGVYSLFQRTAMVQPGFMIAGSAGVYAVNEIE